MLFVQIFHKSLHLNFRQLSLASCRCRFRRAFLSEGHGTAKRELERSGNRPKANLQLAYHRTPPCNMYFVMYVLFYFSYKYPQNPFFIFLLNSDLPFNSLYSFPQILNLNVVSELASTISTLYSGVLVCDDLL